MRKHALNKTELTKLRREEAQYEQFLPVLRLKTEQLQVEQRKIRRRLVQVRQEVQDARGVVLPFAPLLAEALPLDLEGLVRLRHVRLGRRSVAGVTLPTLDGVSFEERTFSRFGTPPWVALTLPALRELVRLNTEQSVIERQDVLVGRQLRKATQKVNLFEKVLLPETRHAIRRIKIALGDEQVAAVGRGKIAKRKQAMARSERGHG